MGAHRSQVRLHALRVGRGGAELLGPGIRYAVSVAEQQRAGDLLEYRGVLSLELYLGLVHDHRALRVAGEHEYGGPAYGVEGVRVEYRVGDSRGDARHVLPYVMHVVV